MAEEEEVNTLENKIFETSELIEEFVNEYVEKDGIDPLQNTLINFDGSEINKIIDTIKEDPNKKIIYELSSRRVLANFLGLGTSENDYNLKQIGTLLDFSFYIRKIGESLYDMPYELIKGVLKEGLVDWLLKFWSYFDLRIEEIKRTKDNETLVCLRHPGSSLLITINLRINQLYGNHEPSRDILKAKLLGFTSKIFPAFDKSLINKNFEFNQAHLNTVQYQKVYKNHAFNAFWELQRAFANPSGILVSDRTMSEFMSNASLVYKKIYDAEERANDGPLFVVGKKNYPTNTDKNDYNNSIENYTKAHLTEAKRQELQDFYSNRDYNMSFLVNEKKFNEQIRNDQTFRKTFLIQLIIVLGFFSNLDDARVLDDARASFNLRKAARVATPYLYDIRNLRREANNIFNALDKREFFGNQMLISSEFTFFQAKLKQFRNVETIYNEVQLDDELYDKLKQEGAFKKRFWALYGNAQISSHWKIPTGLSLLEKDTSKNTREEKDKNLEILRETIKSTEDQDLKDVVSWKALRLSRQNHLFDFKHVNGSIGLEGLYDHSLKEADDIKRKEETEKLEKEEEEELAAYAKKVQDEKAELERKRKASEDEFAEQSKRAKLDSANGSKDAEDLDY
ncbi:THO complex subunit [Wickerhamomyces ciferrii]|uniref:THO complex subunit n=1 Tax=Wickerhamomyces ciferrii (strain ATCC 14091 / BCRC 22168 / CBS 111 / JCM 3599 / NBRC 0793 / NRRL Y-1031 F-60-10) TaxID=1206466 RepID=K0KI02_WICCF|nr:THO complex subunit [Wickerhamomyces ciferrii]CCH41782.1 THO complex subunit [Wickerhamomyces ciferrii]